MTNKKSIVVPTMLYFRNGKAIGAIFPNLNSTLHIPDIKVPTIFSYKKLKYNKVKFFTAPTELEKGKAKAKAKEKPLVIYDFKEKKHKQIGTTSPTKSKSKKK